MSGVSIVVDDLAGPEVAALLAEHLDDMRAASPPESKHALDLEALRRPVPCAPFAGYPEDPNSVHMTLEL